MREKELWDTWEGLGGVDTTLLVPIISSQDLTPPAALVTSFSVLTSVNSLSPNFRAHPPFPASSLGSSSMAHPGLHLL